MHVHHGIPASPGYAVGPVYRIRKQRRIPQRRTVAPEEVPVEQERFREAVARARRELEELSDRLRKELGADEAEIIASQLLILEDELTWDRTLALIAGEKLSAESAFTRAITDIVVQLSELNNPSFRERVNDLRDVEERVIRACDDTETPALVPPPRPSIVAAHDLTPSDTATIGRSNVLAFVLDEGGRTGHVAILARSIGVPAVVGLGDVVAQLAEDEDLAVDGGLGEVVAHPDTLTRDRFVRLSSEQVTVARKLDHLKDLPAESPDGRTVQLLANIEMPVEVEQALARGAEGIGLLRTEYLYFQHRSIPTEDEQAAAYGEIVRRMAGRPVTFRTLDVGGDKISGYLGAKREYNPFLGWRGIRFCLANRGLFKAQIRAIYRAAADGPVRLMFPMISGVEELRAAVDVCLECRFEMQREGVRHDPEVDIGIMIETPSAAAIADLLAKECDFFSVGTNDLIQYSLAIDRGNSRVAYLYRPLHPAVLRQLQQVVETAHEAGIDVGLCGEMGSETRYAEVMLGLGFDELSLHGAAIPKVKQVIRWTPVAEARQIVDQLLAIGTGAEADAWLTHYLDLKKAQRTQESEDR